MSNDPIGKSHRILSVVPGELLGGRYRIGTAIGTGAYGEIFGAVDESTGQQVAIKALSLGSRSINDTARGRFQREMMIIRNLDHPHIIGIYDWGETEHKIVFMVLEYVEGHTLERIVRNQPMVLGDALDVAWQIASALEAAHAQGVIHRDLKPANIMLSSRDDGGYVVKVLDFGMAKVLSKIEDESIVELTREGMAVGTPRYIAPEQARGLPVGPGADLYALGLLLYEILTGVQAVQENSVELAVRAHVSPEPLELAAIDRVPAVVRPILAKLLEKRVENRYQSAGDVMARLDTLRKALELYESTLEPGFGAVDGGVLEPGSGEGLRIRGFIMPRNPVEIVEVLVASGFLLMAWLLIVNQFSGRVFFVKFMMGLSLPLMAGILAFVLDSEDWKYGIWRLLGVVSLVAIGVVLVVGL